MMLTCYAIQDTYSNKFKLTFHCMKLTKQRACIIQFRELLKSQDMSLEFLQY